jgi:hypothetical protein
VSEALRAAGMVSRKETSFETKCGEVAKEGVIILCCFCHLFSLLSHSLIASQPKFIQTKIFVGGWQVVSFRLMWATFSLCCNFFCPCHFFFLQQVVSFDMGDFVLIEGPDDSCWVAQVSTYH